MTTILNITNGDSAVKIMKQASIEGDFLPWRDVLHDGPVPADLNFEALSEVRAKFIIDRGWGSPQVIKHDFYARDQKLQAFRKYAKVILWFEHDLYDQLQILQILDWFSTQSLGATQLRMICTDNYLGMLNPTEMLSLRQFEQDVTPAHLQLAKQAWAAFRAPTPELWQALLKHDTAILPYLDGAIIRQLEEYPSSFNGLSRTAQMALTLISTGESKPGRIFARYQDSEERRYMGDSSFWEILRECLASDPPLLSLPAGKKLTLPTSPDQILSLTSTGEAVLSGQQNWLTITPLERWIGGVHLTPDNQWCWDALSQRVTIKR